MSSTSVFALKDQGPIYLMGLGHGATHWIAGIFYIVLPLLRDDLGLSYTQAGLLVSILHVSSFVANFGSGALVDITGRKVALQIASLVVGALALAVFGLTGIYLILCLMVALIGATNNLWHPPAIAFISSRYPKHRGYALSIHATGASIGDMIAPLAAGAVLAELGWRTTALYSTAPVFVVVGIFVFVLLPRDGASERGSGSKMDFAEYFRGLGAMVRHRPTVGLCLLAAFRSMAQNGLLLFLPLYLMDVLKTSPVVMGTALMAMHLAGAVVSPIAGTVSDRIGRRPVVMAGLGASTVTIFALTFAPTASIYIVGVSVLGFVLYAVRPVVHSWLMDISPAGMQGSASSLLFGTQSLLSIAMPALGGMVADAYGLVEVFYLIAAMMLLANVMCVLLPAPQKS
jgi:MFS family permease